MTNGSAPSQVLAESIAHIAQDEGSAIVQFIFPIRILASNDSEYVIGAGQDIVAAGQVYEVMSRGKTILDPDTHESLGRIENYCCRIRVDRVADKMAYGSLLPPAKSLSDFSPDRYVLGNRVVEREQLRDKSGSAAMRELQQEIKRQNQEAGGAGR